MKTKSKLKIISILVLSAIFLAENAYAATMTVDFNTSEFTTNVSANNIAQTYNYLLNPGNALPTGYYTTIKSLNPDYYEVMISKLAFDSLCGSGPNCNYDYSNLDTVLDEAVGQNLNIYLRYSGKPTYMNNLFTANGYTQTNIDAFANLVKDVTQHVVTRYGTAVTRNWIFSFDNEKSLDTIGGGNWDTGSEIYSNFMSQVAAKIKAVDGQLSVAAMESFIIDDDYMVRYLISHNELSRLADVDILSYHHYGDFSGSDNASNALLSIDTTAGPPHWRSEDPTNTTKDIRDLLDNNGLSRVKIWQGENNFNNTSDSNDATNSGVDGGLYFALSELEQSESGLKGVVHWEDIGSQYGIMNSTDGTPYDIYYAQRLMHDAVRFFGPVSFYSVTPDNWDDYNNGSNARAFAVFTGGKRSLIVFNINETQAKTVNVTLNSPEITANSKLIMYTYNAANGGAASLQPASFALVSPGSGIAQISTSLDPLTMAIFQIDTTPPAAPSGLSVS